MVRQFSITVDNGVSIPMRDGVRLIADIYRPAKPGTWPVILQRTPYGRIMPSSFAIRAAGSGYVVVIQDTRGRWDSEGTFHAFPNEQRDGFDTCAWICSQPWSNERIGMFGASYVGLTQWQAALAGAPGLQAIVPNVTAADYHEGWTYQGGAFELSFNKSWTMTWLASDTARRLVAADPSQQAKLDALYDRTDAMEDDFAQMPLAGDPLLAELAPYYDEWLAHPDHGPLWDRIKVDGNYGQLDQAVLHCGAWYDIFLGGTLRNFQGMHDGAKTAHARANQRLLIGPWDHMTIGNATPVGTYDPGVRSWHATIDFDGIHLRFYDRHLRDLDNGLDGEDPVRIFVMGENRWRSEMEWPLARTLYVDYFLHSHGAANTLHGDGTLSPEEPGFGERPDHYIYDPLNPVPTAGGALCCNEAKSNGGVEDQRHVEARSDVLCYTTAPLAQPTEITGPITVTLFAATSAVDTDWTAKLVDVCPCGCVRNLTDGIIRARYRQGTSRQVLLTPGEIYEYTIDLWATSMRFPAGHQIRLEISSSNFPRFDRNPNTGGDIATATREECVVAFQTVHHTPEYPSRITLPMIHD
ncbi:MAG TPA: CocE/NonD family hydrolase [Thermomicrobiales bacterium]|nr:CocE/NonD family hydrolase [Thermomicrobiales bacterium]